jgi:hypothetical protein
LPQALQGQRQDQHQVGQGPVHVFPSLAWSGWMSSVASNPSGMVGNVLVKM